MPMRLCDGARQAQQHDGAITPKAGLGAIALKSSYYELDTKPSFDNSYLFFMHTTLAGFSVITYINILTKKKEVTCV
jgi:hypothetical protein